MKNLVAKIAEQVKELIEKVESGTSSVNDRINLAVLTDALNNLKPE